MDETNLEKTPIEENNDSQNPGEKEDESRILEFFEYKEGIQRPSLNDKLIILYDQ